MKNKKIPVRTVLRSKTQILETGEHILSGNITLILITSLVCANSPFYKLLWNPLRIMSDNEQKEKWKTKILIPNGWRVWGHWYKLELHNAMGHLQIQKKNQYGSHRVIARKLDSLI